MANAMPDEKESELHIELPHLGPELQFFLVAGIGDDGHSDESDQHACHGEEPAAGGEKHRALSVHEWRHQSANDQRDADGHADA
jgi:hypothetical protein